MQLRCILGRPIETEPPRFCGAIWKGREMKKAYIIMSEYNGYKNVYNAPFAEVYTDLGKAREKLRSLDEKNGLRKGEYAYILTLNMN